VNGTVLPALYLPYKQAMTHAFELDLIDFVEHADKGDILVLHAPTGAGKTHVILKLTKRVEGVLLCVPTNALAAEVEDTYKNEFSPNVCRWNAEALLERGATPGIPRHERMIDDARNKSLIVSNPDILHLFTQHEYVPENARIRMSGFGMRNLDLIVFDEYHAYDERILASILLYIAKTKSAKDNRQKFIFMSATPDNGLTDALEAIGLSYRTGSEVLPTTEPLDQSEGRMIKGEIEIEISQDSILASLPTSPLSNRTLFIFSKFIDQQNAVRILKRIGLVEKDIPEGFVQITGRKTKSEMGQDSWNHANILLATSKVDVGLNISNLDKIVMEPGWTEQQFWQRFGRAARGKNATVKLHFPDYPGEVLAPLRASKSYPDMSKSIQTLLRTDRHHVDSILRYFGAYAACYHENTPSSADWKTVDTTHFTGSVKTGYGLVQIMFRTWEEDVTRDDPGGSGDWMRIIRQSLRGLRGKALNTRAIYSWSPDDAVDENIMFILSKTEWHKRGNDYIIDDFVEKPCDVILHYSLLDGAEASVQARKGYINKKEFLKLSSQMKSTLAQPLGDPLPPFWEALVAWLQFVFPDDVIPKEVTQEDIFILQSM
jgi:hypothetical protein